MKRDSLKFDVNESPSLFKVIALAVMHVLLIFDAIIFIPNVLGQTRAIPPVS